ncbi:glycoside hydrolase family 105 protein [Mesorhizobium sp. B1-1-8]|uniref:beta-galactosidase BglB n=1 Tax=Mesorhizobium sp. B1-1-8 TaxID=2589976 RepID=UPI001129E3D1|nr:glycoside hydrolase family 88 protein [Mesorhizobium sp. B1-1-8]UCI07127.1 glycoside hydrolase family 88 protein [Mesorhizobium sp. B1-1-8]
MSPAGETLRQRLNLLVAGITGLRHSGRFDEPNLDGTAGDYISFDAWEWPQGVGLYGLVRLWQHTRDDKLRQIVEDWYAGHLASGLPALNINTTAPMLALSVLWKETREERWRVVLDDWAGRLIAEAPRTFGGAFQHDVSDRINDHELWDDTLFMAALFLASYGEAAGRRDLVDEAEKQFLVHAHYLADRETGLWFHGWTFDGWHNFAKARWARGNAWITVGILDLIELAEISAPVRDFLLAVLTSQVEAILKLQAPSGAWRTLLDDVSSYEEISATAGFGYGLLKASRLGLGPGGCRRAGLKALQAVLGNIGDDGTVANVSYGTRMGHDLQFYRDIPIQPTGYGQALAMLCLVEGLHHADELE